MPFREDPDELGYWWDEPVKAKCFLPEVFGCKVDGCTGKPCILKEPKTIVLHMSNKITTWVWLLRRRIYYSRWSPWIAIRWLSGAWISVKGLRWIIKRDAMRLWLRVLRSIGLGDE